MKMTSLEDILKCFGKMKITEIFVDEQIAQKSCKMY